MVPSKAFLASVPALVGADVAWLAQPTTFVQVALVVSPFTASPNLALGSLTLASFTGSAAIHAASAATQVYRDPVTGNWYARVSPPAGGWHWICTAAPTPQQTVYGVVLLTSDGATIIGSDQFAVPVVVAAVGDGVEVDDVYFRFPAGIMA